LQTVRSLVSNLTGKLTGGFEILNISFPPSYSPIIHISISEGQLENIICF
jgi:hypothetical protein